MIDQTIHNVTSHDWVVIDWIGENRTLSASALTWLEWHEELLELRAERDALAAELSRLRTLEAAAIEWAKREEEFLRNKNSTDLWAAFCMAGKRLKTECRKPAEAAREAEKARK